MLLWRHWRRRRREEPEIAAGAPRPCRSSWAMLALPLLPKHSLQLGHAAIFRRFSVVARVPPSRARAGLELSAISCGEAAAGSSATARKQQLPAAWGARWPRRRRRRGWQHRLTRRPQSLSVDSGLEPGPQPFLRAPFAACGETAAARLSCPRCRRRSNGEALARRYSAHRKTSVPVQQHRPRSSPQSGWLSPGQSRRFLHHQAAAVA